MAYVKYKELTKYINFNKKIAPDQLPEYVKQYLEKSEVILIGYKVHRDLIVITDKKFVIFDIRGILTDIKKIHYLPYKTMSSGAIEYYNSKISIYATMDSGYQMKLSFVNLSPEDKKELRCVFTTYMQKVVNR